MALTVGVTGHRPAGLGRIDKGILERRVRETLAFLASRIHSGKGGGQPPRLLSPLAEGADRLVARLALEGGWELVSILPFARRDYERDFLTSDSRREFSRLLAKARTVRELGGVRQGPAGPEEAYAAVGAAVVEESDFLLALWDGERARGRGGTGEVVDSAVEHGIPVIWIDARPPHRIMVLPERLPLESWWSSRAR